MFNFSLFIISMQNKVYSLSLFLSSSFLMDQFMYADVVYHLQF